MAREGELLLARLEDKSLTLLTTRGDLQARTRIDELTSATISDDGSAVVAVGSAGQVWWLSPDLSTHHEHAIRSAAIAVAIEPFGRYLAVSDRQSNLHILDRHGRSLARVQSPRPIRHLAFAPTTPHLIAAADFGWAGCLHLKSGEWLWSDRPVSNIGSVAVGGNDGPVLLGCFSEGIRHYAASGNPRTVWTMPGPCGLVSLSFAGDAGVASGTAPQLFGFDARGESTFVRDVDCTPTAIALAGLGDRVFLGDATGSLKALRLPSGKQN
jgi:hypothetical protein